MGIFLNLINKVALVGILISFLCCVKNIFKENNKRGIIGVFVGVFAFIFFMYSSDMQAPICSTCEARMADGRDTYCSVCGDIWDENDLPYWKMEKQINIGSAKNLFKTIFIFLGMVGLIWTVLEDFEYLERKYAPYSFQSYLPGIMFYIGMIRLFV